MKVASAMRARFAATFLCALLLLATSTSSLGAQIAASQGSADPNRVQYFHSPMILEFPIKELFGATRGVAFPIRGIQRFGCDGAHFTTFKVTLSGSTKRGFRLRVDGAIEVERSHDREAKVIVQVVSGGRIIATGDKDKIDAEERKIKPFRLSVPILPADSLMLENAEEVLLRVTLFVWDS